MEVIIIWVIFMIIVIMNMNKAKKMQRERMQEHQRNMQEHQQDMQQIRERNNFQGKSAVSGRANETAAMSPHRAEAPVPQYTAPPPAADNAAPVMKTLDKAEFHSPVMQAGTTGTYSDMTGGHTFTQYDCGHEYNDEIVPQSKTSDKGILDDLKFDTNEMRKAFVMQEILKRKVI